MSSSETGAAGLDPVPVFAALGDRTRLSLLSCLAEGQSRSITSLAGDTGLSRQAVTKHLRVLERVGLVATSRVGREARFRYRPEGLATAHSYLDTVSAQWDDTLARLRRLVED